MPRSPWSKKLNLARAYVTGSPIWCAWQVNYRCNFRCRFCKYWMDPMGDEPELSPEGFHVGGKKLAELGSVLISLAGGEPLMRPDIVDIVQALAEWHMPFVTTNGWFVTPDLAKQLFEAGLWGVSISIDYADADRHDAARGQKGAYERALAAMDAFASARQHKWQRVNWMSVLLDDNLDQIEPMIKLAAKHGAYFMVQPYGVRKTGSQKFVNKNQTVSQYLLELQRRYPNFLSNPYFLAKFDQATETGVPGCKAGRGFFNIDSTGDVAVCVEEKHRPVANLFEHSAKEIVKRLKQDPVPKKCTACWYNCRGEIESLYTFGGVMKRLSMVLCDRGEAPSAD